MSGFIFGSLYVREAMCQDSYLAHCMSGRLCVRINIWITVCQEGYVSGFIFVSLYVRKAMCQDSYLAHCTSGRLCVRIHTEDSNVDHCITVGQEGYVSGFILTILILICRVYSVVV